MDRLDQSNIYTDGFVDGICELLDVLQIAMEDAPAGERLPAIERIIAEYAAQYRNTEYGKQKKE